MMKCLIKILCVAGFVGAAFGQISAGLFATYEEADARFEEITQNTKEPPRLVEADNKNIIRQLSDSKRWLDSDIFQKSNLSTVIAMCDKAHQKVLIYTLLGLESRVDSKSNEPLKVAAQIRELMAENYKKYSDELALLEPFSIRCIAKQLAPLELFLKTLKLEELTQVRLDGLNTMKKGIVNVYIGSLSSAVDEKITNAHLLSLISTLADVSVEFSGALGVGQRQIILNNALTFRTKAPIETIQYLDRIIKMMERTDCEKLCKY